MVDFLAFLSNLSDPEWIVANGGLYLLLFIIFAETGIFIGFFLPGDPMLFIAGIIIASIPLSQADSVMTLLYWILAMSTAGILGNFVGYWTGRRFGPYLVNRRDSFIFKRAYLQKAEEFYHKRGGGAIILARFLPVVRTFAPIVAGIVRMDIKKFALYNITGAFLWVGSIVSAGYLLGDNEWVKGNLEYVIFGIVALATLPVALNILKNNVKKKKPQAESAQEPIEMD